MDLFKCVPCALGVSGTQWWNDTAVDGIRILHAIKREIFSAAKQYCKCARPPS